MHRPDVLEGGVVRLPAAIGQQFAARVTRLLAIMMADTRRQLVRLYTDPNYALDAAISIGLSEGGNLASRARIVINALLTQYRPVFAREGKRAAERMVERTLKHSTTALGLSLREIGEGLSIDTSVMNDRVKLIVAASTNEAAMLIRVLPQTVLGEVQGAVMRSITTGRGLADLVPFMTQQYGEAKRHARNVALDQTRKSFNSITAAKMDALGVQEFRWIHSGGGQHPRKQHQQWHGQVFRLDDLPVDERFGPVIPGQSVNCRCTLQPLVTFGAKGRAPL
jgi:SPP1 gp7 family putative phage head morphogenesis protein